MQQINTENSERSYPSNQEPLLGNQESRSSESGRAQSHLEGPIETDLDRAENAVPKQIGDPESFDRNKANRKNEISQNENVCGVILKRGKKPVHLLPLMGLYFTNCCAGVFMSAWVVFLLRDPAMGNVPADQIGRVTAKTLLF